MLYFELTFDEMKLNEKCIFYCGEVGTGKFPLTIINL